MSLSKNCVPLYTYCFHTNEFELYNNQVMFLNIFHPYSLQPIKIGESSRNSGLQEFEQFLVDFINVDCRQSMWRPFNLLQITLLTELDCSPCTGVDRHNLIICSVEDLKYMSDSCVRS